jgi:glycosyltransferase involved in cell wall biosynthesis
MNRAEEVPTVSIVTVVQNGVPWIEETITSVLGQDYAALEYWVVDGASTDGTVELLRRNASRLAGWVSEPDAGIADAFNKGLARARGDYIMFLNADDALASPSALSSLVDAARHSGWPDVIYGDCDLIDRDSGEVLYRHAAEYDRRRFLQCGTLPHPGMLMHRRYFERFGRFDTSYRIAMDYELQLRGVPETGAVRAPVLVTRVRTGGLSTIDRSLAMEEGLRALRMAGHLRSAFAEARLRAYFRLRSAAHRVLEAFGLHRRFELARRRRAQPGLRRG